MKKKSLFLSRKGHISVCLSLSLSVSLFVSLFLPFFMDVLERYFADTWLHDTTDTKGQLKVTCISSGSTKAGHSTFDGSFERKGLKPGEETIYKVHCADHTYTSVR